MQRIALHSLKIPCGWHYRTRHAFCFCVHQQINTYTDNEYTSPAGPLIKVRSCQWIQGVTLPRVFQRNVSTGLLSENQFDDHSLSQRRSCCPNKKGKPPITMFYFSQCNKSVMLVYLLQTLHASLFDYSAFMAASPHNAVMRSNKSGLMI